MFKLMKIAAAATALFGVQAIQASVLIDDFTVGQNLTVGAATSGGSVAGNGTTSCVNIIGCYRDIYVDNSNAGNQTTANTVFRPAVGPGATPVLGAGWELATNVSSGDTAKFFITYDGDAVDNNLRTTTKIGDFSGTGGLQFYVKSDGGGGGDKQVSIALYDTSGHVLATQFAAFSTFGNTCPADPANPDCYVLATFSFGSEFASVGAAGAFDFANVSALQAVVNVTGSTQSLDFALRTVTTSVPEPGSVALAGLALLGLGAARRRRA